MVTFADNGDLLRDLKAAYGLVAIGEDQAVAGLRVAVFSDGPRGEEKALRTGLEDGVEMLRVWRLQGCAFEAQVGGERHVNNGVSLGNAGLVAGRDGLEVDREGGVGEDGVGGGGQPGEETFLDGVLEEELGHAAVGKFADGLVGKIGGYGDVLPGDRDMIVYGLEDGFELAVAAFVADAGCFGEVLLPAKVDGAGEGSEVAGERRVIFGAGLLELGLVA